MLFPAAVRCRIVVFGDFCVRVGVAFGICHLCLPGSTLFLWGEGCSPSQASRLQFIRSTALAAWSKARPSRPSVPSASRRHRLGPTRCARAPQARPRNTVEYNLKLAERGAFCGRTVGYLKLLASGWQRTSDSASGEIYEVKNNQLGLLVEAGYLRSPQGIASARDGSGFFVTTH